MSFQILGDERVCTCKGFSDGDDDGEGDGEGDVDCS